MFEELNSGFKDFDDFFNQKQKSNITTIGWFDDVPKIIYSFPKIIE